ncbi:hypothetical protein [Bacillus thuringiensis]|uniref:hypothetical protein n=1 Tax=Bacillus thuringiensis TaxID=1428 RepID=UPI002079D4CB|nr:hypothetical protein [Bacillus thuringiensis]USL15777.1 hypothetical protein LIT28_11430 [Bacillus thuringiensis]
MDSFLALLIFTFPGLITYFWIQLFGVTPTVRYQGTEILAISAILWIPVNIVVLIIYNISIFLIKTDLYSILNLVSVYDMKSLNAISGNFYFLLYYVAASTVISYIFAKVMSGKLYDKALNKINAIRARNNKAPLSRESSVWDVTFSLDQAQIVAISKIDNPEKFLIGELQNASRTYELEKNLVLRETEHWKKIFEDYDISVEKVFIDVKTGIKIEIYDSNECIQAQSMYIQNQQTNS